MPPAQCPACGRFLPRAFVARAERAPTPCPSCEVAIQLPAVPAGGAVAPAPPHPLDDWDRDVPADARPRPHAVVPLVVAAVGAGAALGAVLAGDGRRLRGGVLGALAGAIVGATVRRGER